MSPGLPPHQIALSLECASSTGSSSSTAYTCTTTPSFTPVNGDVIQWDPGANDLPNTGIAPTLAVNGGSAIVIKKNAAAQPLNPGDVGLVKSTSQYELVYDGTNWQLMSQTANDISTYNNAPNNALSAFYACLANSDTNVCRIVDNADSEHTCWLTSTCAFGPQHEQNLPLVAMLTYLATARLSDLFDRADRSDLDRLHDLGLFSNGVLPGITCTGTVTQVSLSGVGPQQATGALTGGGTLQMASGAVCTVAISTFVYNGKRDRGSLQSLPGLLRDQLDHRQYDGDDLGAKREYGMHRNQRQPACASLHRHQHGRHYRTHCGDHMHHRNMQSRRL